jgi:hypothetical protein
LFPITQAIIDAGLVPKAVDTFPAQYRLQELTQSIRPLWDKADRLLAPTPGTAFTLAELEAEPIARNTDLGYYTISPISLTSPPSLCRQLHAKRLPGWHDADRTRLMTASSHPSPIACIKPWAARSAPAACRS